MARPQSVFTEGIGSIRALSLSLRSRRRRYPQIRYPTSAPPAAQRGLPLEAIEARLGTLTAARDEHIATGTARVATVARQLCTLRTVAETSAAVFSAELFGTRTFRNGRQLGALLGLVPVPYRSDQAVRDQGIRKAGPAELRGMWLQIAWGWLRWHPNSAVAQWFQRRVGAAGGRSKRIGIVALATNTGHRALAVRGPRRRGESPYAFSVAPSGMGDRRACTHWCEPLAMRPGPPVRNRPIDGAARPNGPAHGRSWCVTAVVAVTTARLEGRRSVRLDSNGPPVSTRGGARAHSEVVAHADEQPSACRGVRQRVGTHVVASGS